MSTKAQSGFTDEQGTGFDQPTIPIEEVQLATCQLHEMGEELPVGVFDSDGNRNKDFQLLEFSGEHEIAIEKLFNVNTPGIQKVTNAMREIIPLTVKSIGGKKLTDYNSDPRALVDNMFLGDAMMLLLSIRANYRDGSREIAMSARCDRCGTQNSDQGTFDQPYHDLGTVPVKYYPELAGKPLFEVTLPKGFDWGKDTHITKMVLTPMKVRHLKQMSGGSSSGGKMFDSLNALSSLTVALPESPLYSKVRGRFVDESMYKRLISDRGNKATVEEAMEKLYPGPIMAIDFDCYNCGHHWKESVPWAMLPTFLYGVTRPVQNA